MTARAIVRIAAALAWTGICLSMFAVSRPFGRERVWVRRFLKGIGWILGLRVRWEGPLPREATLLVANHITWLDILAIGGVVESCFIAKSQIRRWPLVGWLAKTGGTIFVSRERRTTTRDQADVVAEGLRDGWSVVLFPEAGTGDGHIIVPFRAPLFVSAIETGVPVQPVAVDYGPDRARLAWPSGAGFGAAAKQLVNRPGLVPVTLKFLDPLDAHALDRKQLAALSHQAITSALDPAPM